MNNYISDIYSNMQKVSNKFENINNLINWSAKTYGEFSGSNKDKELRYCLVKIILRRIRDIYFDISDSDDLVQEDINTNIIDYFNQEFLEIYMYLEGKINYNAVYLICDNLLERDREVFGDLVLSGRNLLNDATLSEEKIDFFKDTIKHRRVLTKDDVIFCETINIMININKMLKSSNSELRVGGYGVGEYKLDINNEKKLLIQYLEAIEGKISYRLTICVNRDSILYTTINFIC